MSARAEILARIRAAVADDPGEELPVADDYRSSPSLSSEQRIELFVERMSDYDATVHRVGEHEISATVAQALTRRSASRILVPGDFPSAWLPSGFDLVVDSGLSYVDLDQLEGVLTTCTAAIALTGTIILQDGPGLGRRAATLIPDYHLCVVRESQVYETVPEAIRVLEANAARPTTTISGPSATADIEMTRIRGVHGPRTLEIILVS